MKAALLEALGRPGIVGLGILLFCLSFYFGNLQPLSAELTRLKAEQARLSAMFPGGVAASQAGIGERTALPAFASAPDTLKAMVDLAGQHGIAIDRATFRVDDQPGRRRLQVVLPLQVGYPALRAWLRELLAQSGAPTLDELKLQRPRADATVIEAEVLLSFHFAPS